MQGLQMSSRCRETRARRPPIVVHPLGSSNAPATLIFIHGYNFFASQFNCSPPNDLSVAHHIHLSPSLRHVKVVIAEALSNVHQSMHKNTWFNIETPNPPAGSSLEPDKAVESGIKGVNENDMNVSMDYFESLIISEMANGTPANRIVFMGDSQGATILSIFILTRKLAAELGGIIAYAGFGALPLQSISRIQQERGLVGRWSKETKFFQLHGASDVFVPIVYFDAWRRTLERFTSRGQGIASLEWKVIEDMNHPLTFHLWPHVRKILQDIISQDLSSSVPRCSGKL